MRNRGVANRTRDSEGLHNKDTGRHDCRGAELLMLPLFGVSAAGVTRH